MQRLKAEGLNLADRNKILLHPNESVKHFFVKAIIGKILFERKYGFLTEVPIIDGNDIAVADVFDYQNGIDYEVQTKLNGSVIRSKQVLFSSKMVKDVIFVEIRKVSNDIHTAYRQLERIVV